MALRPPRPARHSVRVLLVSIVTALLATACTGTDDEGIRLWLFGGPEERAAYEELLTAFAEVRPDVAVTLDTIPRQDDLLAKLTTAFAGGAPPDVFLLNFRKYGGFAAQGVLAPVQPQLDQSDELSGDDFVATSLEAFRFDGTELMCLPQNVSTLVLYLNLDLLEDAGVEVPAPDLVPGRDAGAWDWDELAEAAARATDPASGTWGLGLDPKLIRLAPMVWSAGGDVVDDSDAPTRLTLDTGPGRAALDRLLDLALVDGVIPPEAQAQSEDHLTRFLNGRLAVFASSRREVPTLRTIETFDWDVRLLPAMPEGPDSTGTPATILHSDAWCMAANGDVDAAWALVEFANTVEGQSILARSGRTVPSRPDVATSAAFLRTDLPPASATVFLRSAELARATPHTASWLEVEKAADRILEEMFVGRLDRAAGLDRLVRETTPLFDRG